MTLSGYSWTVSEVYRRDIRDCKVRSILDVLVYRVHRFVEFVLGPGQRLRREGDPKSVLLFEKSSESFSRSLCVG